MLTTLLSQLTLEKGIVPLPPMWGVPEDEETTLPSMLVTLTRYGKVETTEHDILHFLSRRIQS